MMLRIAGVRILNKSQHACCDLLLGFYKENCGKKFKLLSKKTGGRAPDPGTKCLQVDIFMNVCNKCAMFGESGEGSGGGRRRSEGLKEFPESQCNVNDK